MQSSKKIFKKPTSVASEKNRSQREIRLVFLAANPLSKPPLKLAEELNTIRANIERKPAPNRINVYPYFAARPDNLRGALEIHRPHILHFCGYESDDGGILLENAKRQPVPFNPVSLAQMFGEFSHNVRLVFLNTCRAEKSAKVLRHHVEAVIAFPGINKDEYAIPFAGKFYGGLALGYSIQEAFDQAKSVYFENNIDLSGYPKLFTKKGLVAESMHFIVGRERTGTNKSIRKASGSNVAAKRSVATRVAVPSRQSEVFISYSHKDKKWLDEFHTFLRPILQNGVFCVWDDTKIQPGKFWRKEIQKALDVAKVALLLVSAPFLSSRFIQDKELPPLLKAARAQGLQILWVCLSACPYKETAIEPYQAAHDPSKPLDSLPRPKRNAVLTEICGKIKAAFLHDKLGTS